MKIIFVQSGGFFGMLKACELDTDSATLAETFSEVNPEELEQIVEASGILASGPASGPFFSESSRDLYQYDITIEDGDSEVSVTYDDATLPDSAHGLVDYLRKCARPKALDR